MKSIHVLLFSLISLLVIIALASFWEPMVGATGVPHPDFPGMKISTANIDEAPHTRWLGYLFGLACISVFGSFLFLGNRKNEKPTAIIRWLWIGLGLYTFVYSGMVFSHWDYVLNNDATFFLFMPVSTAWMIFGVWFVPLVITGVYIVKFDDWIINEEEIRTFHEAIGESNK